MFRPQFDYCPPPPGFTDEEFIYSFDGTNTPALGSVVAPGQQNQNIPLQTENDAEFFWRATKVKADPVFGLGIRLKDAFGNYLSDDYVPAWLYGNQAYSGPPGSVSTVREPETRLLKGATVLLDAVNLAGSYTPRLITPSGNNVGLGAYSGVQNATFPWQNREYQFTNDGSGGGGGAGGTLHAMVSTDGGITYVELNPSGVPTGMGFGNYWDGVTSIVTFAYNTSVHGTGTTQLISFDMSTGLWSAPFALGGASPSRPTALWKRIDGTFLVIFSNPVTAPFHFFSDSWNGAAWAGPLDLATNSAGTQTQSDFTSITDSTGLSHVIFRATTGYFYQQITLANTLGNFFSFAAFSLDSSTGRNPAGSLAIMNGSLIWGAYEHNGGGQVYPAIYQGAPLSNPVWQSSGNIDPQFTANPALQGAGSFPAMKYDSVNKILYAAWSRLDPVTAFPGQIVMSTNVTGNPLSGWSAPTLLFALPAAGPTLSVYYPVLFLQYGLSGNLAGWSMDLLSGATEQRYFAGQPISGIKIMFRGVKRRKDDRAPLCNA